MQRIRTSPSEDISYVIFYNKGKELKVEDIKKHAFTYNPLIKNKEAQTTELEADEYALESIERNCSGVSWRSDLAEIYQKYLASENENDLGDNGYWIIKMKGNKDEITQLLSTNINPNQKNIFDRILSIMNNGRTALLTRDLSTQEIIVDNKSEIKKPTQKPRNPHQYRNDIAAAEHYKFFQAEKAKQHALNAEQKNVIDDKINTLLNIIVDKLYP